MDVQAVAAAGVGHFDQVTRRGLEAGTRVWEALPDEIPADIIAELVDPQAVAHAVIAATSS
jgi:hypothetical protein